MQLLPGKFPCLLRRFAVVDLVSSSWVCPPSCSGPPCSLLQCGCWCLYGLISIPAAMLAASLDWSSALCIIVILDDVMMSVGLPFMGMYSSSVSNDVMLFDIFLSSFCIGLSSILFMSSSDGVR